MVDGDKNLETPKKKGKNWMLRIGIALFLFFVMSWILAFLWGRGCEDIDICVGPFLIASSGLIFLFFSLVLISTSLWLRSKNKWIRIISLAILIALITLALVILVKLLFRLIP